MPVGWEQILARLKEDKASPVHKGEAIPVEKVPRYASGSGSTINAISTAQPLAEIFPCENDIAPATNAECDNESAQATRSRATKDQRGSENRAGGGWRMMDLDMDVEDMRWIKIWRQMNFVVLLKKAFSNLQQSLSNEYPCTSTGPRSMIFDWTAALHSCSARFR